MNDATHPVTKAIKRLVWATAALCLTTAAIAVFVFLYAERKQTDLHRQQQSLAAQQHVILVQQRKLTRLAENTNAALCNQRRQLEDGIAAAKKYLKETPNAIPGITPAQIRQNIANQERVLKSLNDLNCAPSQTLP